MNDQFLSVSNAFWLLEAISQWFSIFVSTTLLSFPHLKHDLFPHIPLHFITIHNHFFCSMDPSTNLSASENKPISINLDDSNLPLSRFDLCLAGKSIVPKQTNVNALRNTFRTIWRPKHGLAVRDVGIDLFIFQIFHYEDKYRVLDGWLWAFDDQLFVIRELGGLQMSSDLDFTSSPFWIIHDMALGLQSESTAWAIGNHLGALIEFDNSNLLNLDSLMHIRVNNDVF